MSLQLQAARTRLQALIDRANEGLPISDRDVLLAANAAIAALESESLPSRKNDAMCLLRICKASLHFLHHQLEVKDADDGVELAKAATQDLLTMFEMLDTKG